MISMSTLLPIVTKLGDFLKMAISHYATLQGIPVEQRPDIIAMFLQSQMEGWDPKANGKPLLDDDTRAAAARFLAGVAVNFSR